MKAKEQPRSRIPSERTLIVLGVLAFMLAAASMIYEATAY